MCTHSFWMRTRFSKWGGVWCTCAWIPIIPSAVTRQRFEKPLQNTDIHFGAPTFVVFGYVYKHYIGAATSLNLCVYIRYLREFFSQIGGKLSPLRVFGHLSKVTGDMFSMFCD